ncbi:MAG: hypothetical protein ACO3C8_04050 [Bacilli bacterium]
MGFWDKIKKGFSDAGNAIKDTATNVTNTVVDTAEDVADTIVHTSEDVANTVVDTTIEWYNNSQQVIICGEAIANCAMSRMRDSVLPC